MQEVSWRQQGGDGPRGAGPFIRQILTNGHEHVWAPAISSMWPSCIAVVQDVNLVQLGGSAQLPLVGEILGIANAAGVQ